MNCPICNKETYKNPTYFHCQNKQCGALIDFEIGLYGFDIGEMFIKFDECDCIVIYQNDFKTINKINFSLLKLTDKERYDYLKKYISNICFL